MTLVLPDLLVSARDRFNVETDLQVPAFSTPDDHVPAIDPNYVFERDTTLALLAGFLHNRRVLVQGRHGTGNRATSNRSPRDSTGRACG